MNHIKLFWLDLRAIFGNPRQGKRPFRLLSCHIKIKLSQVYYRIFKIKKTEERVLGMRFLFPNYGVFACLWREIFVREIYYFESLSPAPLIFDVGSNVGISILYFKWLYPRARIIALEADPLSFTWLSKNVEVNKLAGVQLYNVAISSENGVADFFREKDVEGGLVGSLKANLLQQAAAIIRVPTRKLSSFIVEPVDLLKLDIEGSEFDVLPEIQARLAKVRYIAIEVHGTVGTSIQVRKLFEILETHGFRCKIGDANLVGSGFRDFVRGESCPEVFLISAIRGDACV